MSGNGLSRATPWILAAAAAGCSAGGSGSGEAPRVDVPSGLGGAMSEPTPVTPSDGPGAPAPSEGPGDVLFEPGEVPVPTADGRLETLDGPHDSRRAYWLVAPRPQWRQKKVKALVEHLTGG